MVFQVIWSDRAKRELANIASAIRSDNPMAAERLVDELIRRVELISRSPRGAGLHVKRRGFEARQFFHYRYRVFYRVRPRMQRVEIMSI